MNQRPITRSTLKGEFSDDIFGVCFWLPGAIKIFRLIFLGKFEFVHFSLKINTFVELILKRTSLFLQIPQIYDLDLCQGNKHFAFVVP